jgi:predicted secreted hydrolase
MRTVARRLSGILLCAAIAAASAAAADPAQGNWPIPEPGHVFKFPDDHGSHPAFRIKWWYVTGHLFAPGGRRFGFQATFFRSAGPGKPPVDPGFGLDQIFLAHMALTDVENGRFYESERVNREGWDAHASVGNLDVANGSWSLRMPPGGSPTIELSGGVRADVVFQLSLHPSKPVVVFGENGVSRKGSDPSAASYYLTFPRLEARGTVVMDGVPVSVTGQAWMDHEISSSQLGAEQVGWDWTCIQFSKSKRELMLYRLRREDGSTDPASRLQWVDEQGRVVSEPFTWQVLSKWTNPADGVVYPSRVRLGTVDPSSGKPVSYEIVPIVPNQVLSNRVGGGSYWEGACRVIGADGAEAGASYLELTGYSKVLRF